MKATTGTTFNSMNIHDITEVEIKTEILSTNEKPFTLTKYNFIDNHGNIFTVNAFMKEILLDE